MGTTGLRQVLSFLAILVAQGEFLSTEQFNALFSVVQTLCMLSKKSIFLSLVLIFIFF